MITKTLPFFGLLLFSGLIYGQESGAARVAAYTELWDQVMNEGQLDLLNGQVLAEDITLVLQPENLTGIEACRAYYSAFLTGFSDIEFSVIDAFSVGDKLTKHWRFRGKHTADFAGIPPTGRSLDITGTSMVYYKNGKIAQEENFMDNYSFFLQLGVLSDPGNVAVVNGMYEAFAAGDVPGVLSALDKEVVWNEAEGNSLADGNPYVGPEAVLQGVFARIGERHDYFHTRDIKLHDMAGNKVLVTGRYEAKVKGTGKLVDAQMAHLWTLRDGKVIAFQQFVDTKQLAEAESK
ncbi:MAG: nuclear transport factor 2 family protein [Bacteroidota bacterium]